MNACLACDLLAGRAARPGGLIARVGGWAVEHCVGPLGVGTLVVKPVRHVLGVDELTDGEACELGPLLRETSRVVRELTGALQVYNCLWSHGPDAEPVHIHYVVQPVTAAQARAGDGLGPVLQLAMFDRAESPDPAEVEAFAARARERFTTAGGNPA